MEEMHQPSPDGLSKKTKRLEHMVWQMWPQGDIAGAMISKPEVLSAFLIMKWSLAFQHAVSYIKT